MIKWAKSKIFGMVSNSIQVLALVIFYCEFYLLHGHNHWLTIAIMIAFGIVWAFFTTIIEIELESREKKNQKSGN